MTQRRGFTLVEVLIALVIMGLVTGAIYQLLHTNQRLSLAQAEQVSLQSNVRTGSLIVPNELRELNTVLGSLDPTQTDVTVADPNGITYRAMRGLGFVCQAPAGNQLAIELSSWTGSRAPDPSRDDLYVFVDGDVDEDSDDAWQQVVLTGATADAAACGGAGGYLLTGAAAIPALPVNTPVRVFELMRLALYAEGGEWWLGAQSMKMAGSALQPILGPLTADGFELDYLDRNGNVTADRTAITSIRVTVRGLTDKAVRAHGTAALDRPEEALATQVLLRNSIRP